jgi:chromosome segregation ATPase
MRIVIGRASTAAAALLAAAVLALPQVVTAQSLGEAAERAKKERKTGTKSKVITDAELRQKGAGRPEEPVTSSEPTPAAEPTPADGAAPAATEAKPEKTEKTEDELRAEAQANWRDRVQKAQAEVTRLNTEANTLQTSLNDLSQNLYGSNRANSMNRLDEVKKQLAAAQQAVADLQEEGRRSRFQP